MTDEVDHGLQDINSYTTGRPEEVGTAAYLAGAVLWVAGLDISECDCSSMTVADMARMWARENLRRLQVLQVGLTVGSWARQWSKEPEAPPRSKGALVRLRGAYQYLTSLRSDERYLQDLGAESATEDLPG